MKNLAYKVPVDGYVCNECLPEVTTLRCRGGWHPLHRPPPQKKTSHKKYNLTCKGEKQKRFIYNQEKKKKKNDREKTNIKKHTNYLKLI